MDKFNVKHFQELLEKQKIVEQAGKSLFHDFNSDYRALESYKLMIADPLWLANWIDLKGLWRHYYKRLDARHSTVKTEGQKAYFWIQFDQFYSQYYNHIHERLFYEHFPIVEKLGREMDPKLDASFQGFFEVVTQLQELVAMMKVIAYYNEDYNYEEFEEKMGEFYIELLSMQAKSNEYFKGNYLSQDGDYISSRFDLYQKMLLDLYRTLERE